MNRMIRCKLALVMIAVLGLCGRESLAQRQASAEPRVLRIGDYGAVGDGDAADGAAFQKAIAAALETKGPVSLQLEAGKSYRLEARPGITHYVSIAHRQGLTIAGNGATLVLEPKNGAFEVTDSSDIAFTDLVIDYDPLPFTQGSVVAVDPAALTIDLLFHEGFLPPTPDRAPAKPINWANAAVYDADGGFQDEIYIDRIAEISAAATAGRTLRLVAKERFRPQVARMQPGAQIAFRRGGEGGPACFKISDNTGPVRIENVTLHATPKMGFTVTENQGPVTFRNVAIRPRPGTKRLLGGNSDGIHAKGNRVGPVIEHSYFEAMLDDAINIGMMMEVSPAILSPTTFVLRSTSYGNVSPALHAGDLLDAYDLRGGRQLSDSNPVTAVKVLDKTGRTRQVTVKNPIDGMVALDPKWRNAGGAALVDGQTATRFVIQGISNPGFVIRDCVFRNKVRSAIIGRGPGGQITGSVIENVTGYGIAAFNGLQFNEGPVPSALTIQGNRVSNARLEAIRVTASYAKPGLQGAGNLAHDVRITDNAITTSHSGAITLANARAITITGNRIALHGGVAPATAIRQTNAAAVTAKDNKIVTAP